MKKHIVKFLDPTHQVGMNSTCRLGIRDYAPGDIVIIQRTDSPIDLGEGEVQAVHIMPFWRLSKQLIRYQHAKDTRDMDGLYKAMCRAYGEKFDGDEVVTLVLYWLQEAIKDE